MPRANRYFLPNHVWHITHRCHNKEFLLRFARDRMRWRYWLFEARKRYGLCVLNYIVTSNHVHLLKKKGTFWFLIDAFPDDAYWHRNQRLDAKLWKSRDFIDGNRAQQVEPAWSIHMITSTSAASKGHSKGDCRRTISLNRVASSERPGRWPASSPSSGNCALLPTSCRINTRS